MTTLNAYNWLRKLPRSLESSKETPLFGVDKVLDLEPLQGQLEKVLGLKGVAIEVAPPELREAVASKNAFVFQVNPIQEPVYLELAQESLDRLISELFNTKQHETLSNESLKLGFQNFLFMEAIDAFQKASVLKGLTPAYSGNEASLEPDARWVVPLSISWEGGSISGKLLFSDSFREGFKELFGDKTFLPSKKLRSSIFLDVHVEIGRTTLTRSQFYDLNIGDFVILESCQVEPGENKGRAILTVNGTPAFRAKLKDGGLKILETPQFNEIGTPMSTPPEDEDFEEEDEEEEYFEEEEALPENEETEAIETEETTSQVTTASSIQQKPFKASDIPLNIVIEAGRFQMTVDKLSSLEPGNVIDLNISPNDGVDLVVNGISVAKGELLKVGESLGVRIVDIAK